jgi:hypothetical protein
MLQSCLRHSTSTIGSCWSDLALKAPEKLIAPMDPSDLSRHWQEASDQLDALEKQFEALSPSRRTRAAILRCGVEMLECVLRAAFPSRLTRRFVPLPLDLLVRGLQARRRIREPDCVGPISRLGSVPGSTGL